MNSQTWGLYIMFFFTCTLGLAQNNRCGTPPLDHVQLAQQESRINHWLQSHPVLPRTTIVIPVVVHIVYFIGNPVENISDAQIHSQLAVLNQDFRRLSTQIKDINEQFQLLAADVEVEFCLASIDAKGRPTNGITRTETTEKNIANNAFAIKDGRNGGIDAWDTHFYLNIWVGARNDGVLGQATRPGEGNPLYQGLVIDYRAFGTIGTASDNAPYNQGRTVVHEIGHFLGLQHLWGNDNEPSCAQDDGISDTPRQNVTYANKCPSKFDLNTFTCGGDNMYMNFMNYTDDACMAMFSLEQKKKMLAVLHEYRKGFLESRGCGNPVVHTTTFENDAVQVHIYPNPATQAVNLHFPSSHSTGKVALFNALGIKIMDLKVEKTTDIQLSVQHLPRGYYFIVIQTNYAILVKDLLLQ